MNHPTRVECEILLNKYDTPDHVKKHCRAVADTAYVIGCALKEKGFSLDTDLIMSAGMLHDILRVRDKHWEAGADLVKSLGYRAESEIIRVHMTYSPFSHIEDVTETDLVCLGDRLVKEDRYVGLDERIQYIIDKAVNKGKPEAKPFILEKKKDTQRFIDEIEEVIGAPVDRLMEADKMDS
ncbi:MAG: HD domain-containing protein [Clostridiales bacterium]|nr:HD domain-containing protein [Clostridiales bacterium]